MNGTSKPATANSFAWRVKRNNGPSMVFLIDNVYRTPCAQRL
jgi:hypothetical protein